jgi:hypothetical protein
MEEVDRALDNLHKSGKFFNHMPSRRESIPMMGVPRPYAEFGMSSGFHLWRFSLTS